MTSMAWRPGSLAFVEKIGATSCHKLPRATEKWGNQWANSEYLGHIHICLYVTIWIFAMIFCQWMLQNPSFSWKSCRISVFFSSVSLRDRQLFCFFAKNWIRLEDFGPLRGSMSPWWHVWWALHARIPNQDVGMEGFVLIKSTAPSPSLRSYCMNEGGKEKSLESANLSDLDTKSL